MALDDYFVWGNNGARMTPDEIAQQRLLLARKSGIDASPIASPWQGAARVADAIAGAFERGSLDRASKQNDAEATGLRSDIISGFDGSPSAGATSALPALGAASQISGSIPPGTANDIQQQFLDTVKSGYDPGNGQKLAVTNPYGLAAIASTGNAESGWSPQNAGGTWNDGKNPAGGIMSWNGPRLANLQKFAGGTNGTPQQQGQFFLQENPDLIAALNGAKSVDEAQGLMNRAWAFRGYDVPGNAQTAHRLALANGYLPQFQGGDRQVASLNPSAGMGDPAAIAATLPQTPVSPIAGGQAQQAPSAPYRDPMVSAVNSGNQDTPSAPGILGTAPVAQQPAGNAVVNALMNRVASPPSPAHAPIVQALMTAQANSGAAPAQPVSPTRNAALIKALTSPYVDEGTRRLATLVYQRQQAQDQTMLEYRLKQADPQYQAATAKAQYEAAHLGQVTPDTQAALDAAASKPIEVNGRLVNPKTGAVITDMSNPQVSTVDGSLVDNRTGKPIYQSHTPINVNGHMVDPVSGQQVADYSNPNVSDVDGALVDQRTGKVIYQGTPKGVTVDPGQSLVNPQTGKVLVQGSGMKNDDISGIRKEVQQLPSYKNLAQAAPIYKSMLETVGRNTKASDLNMVYGLGKIMDPTSVVREGEVDMARNTASWPDYLKGALETLKGGAALDPQTRSAIMQEAYGRISGYDNEFKQSMTQYQGIAKRYNVNPDDIIPPFKEFQQATAPNGSTSPAAPAAPSGMPSDVWGIMTPEERKLWQK